MRSKILANITPSEIYLIAEGEITDSVMLEAELRITGDEYSEGLRTNLCQILHEAIKQVREWEAEKGALNEQGMRTLQVLATA